MKQELKGYPGTRAGVKQQETLMTPEEIRADFAKRLKRRMEGMASSSDAGAASAASVSDTNTIERCVVNAALWRNAARVVELMLAECNGEEE